MTQLGTRLQGRLVGRGISAAPAIPAARASAPAATEWPGATDGIVVPASSLTGLVQNKLSSKLADDPGIRFGDGSFYLPKLDEVRSILDSSQLDRRTWMEERFDCDDFAYVLKAEMSAYAYKSNELRFALCVGMVWGNFDWVAGYHAVNWFVDSDQELYFIEPQTDEIYGKDRCQGQITLLLV